MKLHFVWIGKTKNAAVKELLGDYLNRIGKYASVEITELKDRSESGGRTTGIVDRESRELISSIESIPFLVVLDERGKQMGSVELANLIGNHRVKGTKELGFVIGGPNGLGTIVRERANLVLALSKMTFPHELARVLLAEQLYRSFAIIHELPYQK